MNVKEVWGNEDFNEMSWHDNYIYKMSFPSDDLRMSLEIDYIFKWELNPKSNFYQYWISHCWLTFVDVLNLKIDLDYKNSTGLTIAEIRRISNRISKNQKVIIWTFEIETDKGMISFDATGFIQKVDKQPVLSQSQRLE
ncbi:MAG: hypothetical protein J0H29_00050 [Sphingobacteriales bacterium]|nr:hypothetical protein [Sphingobacteriales bacterium]OJV56538.1 MAG: hypothetical protein BGO31_06210 [Bacteroidetes bacterium 43-16]